MPLRLSLPREPRSPEPAVAVAVTAEQKLSLSLLKSARLLVRDGMDRLRHNWDRLPQVRGRLLREGAALETDLDQALRRERRTNEIAALVVRGGGWYLEVRLLRSADANGSNPSPRQAAALADIREEFMTNDAGSPHGAPPDNRSLANAMLKLVDVVENLDRGQAELRAETATGFTAVRTELTELRGDVAKLEAGQVELRGDMAELKGRVGNLEAGQVRIEGRVGNLTGREYEQLFRDRLPSLIHSACRQAELPQPAAVDLLWTDRHADGIVGWLARCRDLGLPEPHATALQFCDFIHRVRWPNNRLPPLLLVGEISITVDDRVLEKVKHHRRDLEEAGHEVRTLVAGAGFTPQVADRGGPEAVAAARAQWLARPEDLGDAAWLDAAGIRDMLNDWHDALGTRAGS